jgi:hypothetical protein
MQMFSIGNEPVQEPVYGQPVYGGDQNIIGVASGEVGQQYAAPEPQYIQPDMTYPAEPVYGAETEIAQDQLFGYEENMQQGITETAPVYPQFDQNMPKEMEELAIPSAGNLSAASEANGINAPVIDDISAYQETASSAAEQIPTVEDITVPAFDEIPPAEHISTPILDDITDAEAEPVQVNSGMPAFDNISAPVIDDISAPVFNEPVMAEEEYDTNMSDYNYVAPGTGAERNTAEAEQPKQQAVQQPQIIKVPQLAGYDANNQPVYKYMQMKLAGYDQNGQPVYVPVGAQPAAKPQAAAPAQQAAQPRPQAAAPAQQTAAQAQRAAAAPVQQAAQQVQQQRPVAPVQQAPVRSAVPRKPVQQSGIPSANISKIAVNPHSKSTSQAFINAIASSKDYADKNLIDTQGLQANSPVLTSVEDVLSTMGDETAKRQIQAKVQAQQNVPVFEEYKGPQQNSFRGGAPVQRQQSMERDARYMTKAELKAKKKQDKIDAKFRKEMSKRGF